MHLNTSKDREENQKFYLHQFSLQCLGQFSYYIESDKKAIILDPLREISEYLNLLELRGAQLQNVILTHIHADFVAGHLDLAKRTGAEIILGEGAVTSYPRRIAKDGDIIQLGQVQLRVLYTPGHTLESSSFVLVVDGKDYCVFSGDTLFINEVGRPDLAVKTNEITKEQLAGLMYDSLRTKLMTLADNVILYPGHGAGSSCGKAIGAGTSCTIGKQKETNYALQNISKEQFTQLVVDVPNPPQYFFHDAQLNREGPSEYDKVKSLANKPLTYEEFVKKVNSGCVIIDSREDVKEGLVKDAINISFAANFATFAGTLFNPESKFVIVAQNGKEELTINRLLRIGYENIEGYLEGGFQSYVQNGGITIAPKIAAVEDFVNCKGLEDQTVFIDCRNLPEFQASGVLNGAILAPLPQIEKFVDSLPRDKTLRIYCRSGARAKTAMTLLMKHGFSDFVVMQNAGFEHMAKQPIEIQRV